MVLKLHKISQGSLLFVKEELTIKIGHDISTYVQQDKFYRVKKQDC